tara:strand:+ start:148 stop:585 length:438 start_codon:yes stop_codon:yes gene_type:complete
MPIPKPQKNEKQKDFMMRCVPELSKYHKKDQAIAMCYDAYKKVELKSYNDYPQGAVNNAKRVLKWVEKNGWGSCGEATGKRRANMIASKSKLTRETIARMASFKRHQQHKDVPYSEGCGGLMWDAWGGSAGINWAINKLKEIDKK